VLFLATCSSRGVHVPPAAASPGKESNCPNHRQGHQGKPYCDDDSSGGCIAAALRVANDCRKDDLVMALVPDACAGYR
jgi:hypothetical protein